MARSKEVTPDLDKLLDATPDAPEVAPEPVPEKDEPKQDKPETPEAPAAPEQTAEQAEIAKLRAELAAAKQAQLAPSRGSRPVSDAELTPEQKQIRDLRDEVAREKAKAFEVGDEQYDDSAPVRVIHFVADGFTTQGRTWLTGQTLSFGAEAYEQTKDRNGNSWLDLDEAGQWAAYKKTYFREGPWRGAKYDDEAAREDARRGIAAPLINL